jgi:hypothetical protein
MKPASSAISGAVPLTRLHPELRSPDPMARCHLCGARAADCSLRLWRECDQRDQPLLGLDALLFVCDSKLCAALIEKHPRLYVEEQPGRPGHFPELCGDCQHRDGLSCLHPDLKANGGAGLSVTLSGFANIIICRRGKGGCSSPPRTATKCAGFEKTSAGPGGSR